MARLFSQVPHFSHLTFNSRLSFLSSSRDFRRSNFCSILIIKLIGLFSLKRHHFSRYFFHKTDAICKKYFNRKVIFFSEKFAGF